MLRMRMALGDSWADSEPALSHEDSGGSNNAEGEQGVWDAFKSIFTTTGESVSNVGSDIAAGAPSGGSSGDGRSTASAALDTGAAILNVILPTLVKNNQKPTAPIAPPIALPWYKTPIGIGLIVVGGLVGYKLLSKPKA